MDNYDKIFENKSRKWAITLKKYFPYISLILLTLVVSLIAYYRVKAQINLGPGWDAYDFLANALYFAGHGTGYMDLTRPPLMSFLVAIFFKLGYVSANAISILDGIFYILGVIGLYLFFKLRFNSIKSFLGAFLFATFPIVLTWLALGYTDIASTSLSIWALYFTVLAVKKNSKFFYLAFPFAMFAFLTRYPAAFIIFPMVLYILISGEYLQKLKNMTIGVFLAILTVVPVFLFYYLKFGNPLYPFINFMGSSSSTTAGALEHFAYNTDLFYYIINLIGYIGAVGVAAILVIAFGVIFLLYKIFKLKNGKILNRMLVNTISAENKITKLKLTLFVILTLIFVGTLGKIHYMMSEIVFFVWIYLAYSILRKFKINGLDINLLFLSWFMAYFIFHSVYDVKVGRYFIPMAPAFAYFLILGLSKVTDRIKFKVRNENIMFCIFAVLLLVLAFSSTTSYLQSIPLQDDSNDVMAASNWIMNYDPSYGNRTIYADFYWPYFSWYLKMNVTEMPIFKDGNIYYQELNHYNVSTQDSIAFNNKLHQNNVDYYFCIRKGVNLTGYKPVKQFGDLIIYEKNM